MIDESLEEKRRKDKQTQEFGINRSREPDSWYEQRKKDYKKPHGNDEDYGSPSQIEHWKKNMPQSGE